MGNSGSAISPAEAPPPVPNVLHQTHFMPGTGREANRRYILFRDSPTMGDGELTLATLCVHLTRVWTARYVNMGWACSRRSLFPLPVLSSSSSQCASSRGTEPETPKSEAAEQREGMHNKQLNWSECDIAREMRRPAGFEKAHVIHG